jgi:hypothetical protein
MTTVTFTKQEFEQAIPEQFESVGILQGEECYVCSITDDIKIMLRSTIAGNGVSKGIGDDSIRFWLVSSNLKPLGARISKKVYRTPGWDERLTVRLRELWGLAKIVNYCPDCKVPRRLFRVKKKGPNQGKIFTVCKECNKHYQFIEQD